MLHSYKSKYMRARENNTKTPDFDLFGVKKQSYSEYKGLVGAKIADYIYYLRQTYVEGSFFQNWKKCTTEINQMVNYERTTKTKFKLKFQLSLMRTTYDAVCDYFEEILNVDDLITISPVNGGVAEEKLAYELNIYLKQLLRDMKYADHLQRQIRDIVLFGISPSVVQYQYREPKEVVESAEPKGDEDEDADPDKIGEVHEGSERGYRDLMLKAQKIDRPKCEYIHPYNYWGRDDYTVEDQLGHGYSKTWRLKDVLDAMRLKDSKTKQPLYNIPALEHLKEAMENSQGGQLYDGNDHYDGGNLQNTANDGGIDDHYWGAYTVVYYYRGVLTGCQGFESDGDIYVVECTQDILLRIQRDSYGELYDPITVKQSHPRTDQVIGRSFLDVIFPHAKALDYMFNLSLEHSVQSMLRYHLIYEGSFLNPEILKKPGDLSNILYAVSDRTKPPEIVANHIPGVHNDFESVRRVLQEDQQRAGVSDQEAGITGSVKEETATAAQQISNAAGRKIRASLIRLIRGGVMPEVKNILISAIATGSDAFVTTTAGEIDTFSPTKEHLDMLLNNSNFVINDAITRDLKKENIENEEFYRLIVEFLGELTDTDMKVNMLRTMARERRIPNIDKILPPPLTEQEKQQQEQEKALQQQQVQQQVQQGSPLEDIGGQIPLPPQL